MTKLSVNNLRLVTTRFENSCSHTRNKHKYGILRRLPALESKLCLLKLDYKLSYVLVLNYFKISTGFV